MTIAAYRVLEFWDPPFVLPSLEQLMELLEMDLRQFCTIKGVEPVGHRQYTMLHSMMRFEEDPMDPKVALRIECETT